eukprot:TRINITY_DN56286_c0_g1_i1.p1 TRINITY_DN56286_c0_g1~~TRINITY_DN56286_c0_g1_i1.p1  ORF type:complete len:800 (-),score=101.49 TRINITY_DN56286_c0_g1_i1:188-2332(-)
MIPESQDACRREHEETFGLTKVARPPAAARPRSAPMRGGRPAGRKPRAAAERDFLISRAHDEDVDVDIFAELDAMAADCGPSRQVSRQSDGNQSGASSWDLTELHRELIRLVWRPDLWLQKYKACQKEARWKSLLDLQEMVLQTTRQAIAARSFPTSRSTSGARRDLSAVINLSAQLEWFGYENLCGHAQGDQATADSAKVMLPAVPSTSSPLDLIMSIPADLRRRHRIVIVAEAEQFDSNGFLHEKSFGLQLDGLHLRTDFMRFNEDARKNWALDGSMARFKDHLVAENMPYIFRCRDLAVFRGPQDQGYPFLDDPFQITLIGTAFENSRPKLKTKGTVVGDVARDREVWYSSNKDHHSTAVRFGLAGVLAQQERHPQTDLEPIVIFCVPGNHPKTSLAVSLNHWRKHFGRGMHQLHFCCPGDSAKAVEMGAIINEWEWQDNTVRKWNSVKNTISANSKGVARSAKASKGLNASAMKMKYMQNALLAGKKGTVPPVGENSEDGALKRIDQTCGGSFKLAMRDLSDDDPMASRRTSIPGRRPHFGDIPGCANIQLREQTRRCLSQKKSDQRNALEPSSAHGRIYEEAALVADQRVRQLVSAPASMGGGESRRRSDARHVSAGVSEPTSARKISPTSGRRRSLVETAQRNAQQEWIVFMKDVTNSHQAHDPKSPASINERQIQEFALLVEKRLDEAQPSKGKTRDRAFQLRHVPA